jgi:large subunit ribosomal protein LP1
MSDAINSSYPLVALLIHATKQEVTKEKMQAVFKTLGLDFSAKIASYFALPADKFSSIITNIGSSGSAPASNAAAAESKVEDVPEKEEEESSDSDAGAFDF